jgi:prolyl-tRNA editing enzyme YbaK/EbsC (Cys-tRNA(Pro) deacylase)
LTAAVRAALDAAGVEYELLVHETTYHSAEEGAAAFGVDLAQMAPTLVLRTEQGAMVATVSGTTRLSLKKLKKALRLRNVSLAAPGEVRGLTGADPGTVPLVNPGLATLVDRRLLEQPWAYGGCGVPAHTLKLRPADLVTVTSARVLDIADEKPA